MRMLGRYHVRGFRCAMRNGRWCRDCGWDGSMTARAAKRIEARQVARDVDGELAGADIDSDPWADDRDSEPCSRCGGEVWVECDDPIQCTYRGCNGEIHPDPCCQGTGLARHQVIW